MTIDRNLLFAILALQNHYISKEQLAEALSEWAANREIRLSELLARLGHLDDDDRRLLEALVEKQMARHEGDVESSLAAIPAASLLRQTLAEIDVQLAQTLDHSSFTEFNDELAGETELQPASMGKRFSILRPHASGGLGEVFVAMDHELKRDVALKQIKPQFARNPRQQARFRLEAELTGSLEHPGIVPIYSLGSDGEGRPFYAMRFIQGDSLKEAIDRFHKSASDPDDNAAARRSPRDFQSLEFRALLRRFIDMCNAVGFAHSRGVLHRDLKPGNVMLGNYGETLVVDWGLAKAMGRSTGADAAASPGAVAPDSGSGTDVTAPGSVVGTPGFMSPEQSEGRLDELGPATDVYSLGATLYALLTGVAAFGGRDLFEILEKVRTGDYPPVHHVQPAAPKALAAVCRKAMSLNPDDRYESAAALAAEVEKWLADEPVAAWREPTVLRVRRWIRKRAALATGIAAALTVAMLSLAVGFALLSRAYEKERAAKETARESEALARTNAAKAEHEFRRAKAAVDKYFTEVSKSPELRQKFPGMHEFRIKLLEGAQAYYEEFLKERGQDPELAFDAGQAFYNCGLVAHELGKKRQAFDSWKSAEETFERLHRNLPTDDDYVIALARTRNSLGALHVRAGELREAVEHLDKSRSLLDSALRDRPASVRIAAVSADSLHNLGAAQSALGRDDQALATYRQALVLCENRIRDDPDRPDALAAKAALQSNIALVLRKLGRRDEALGVQLAALELQRKLVQGGPSHPEYLKNLAGTLSNAGNLHRELQRGADALECYREALSIREKIARENPSLAEGAVSLAESYHNLAFFQDQTGDTQGSLENYRKGLAVREELTRRFPNEPRHAIELGAINLNLGAILQKTNDGVGSLRCLDKAVELFETWSTKRPIPKNYRRAAHWNRAATLVQLNRIEDALKDFDKALEFDDGSKKSEIAAERQAALKKKDAARLAPDNNPPGPTKDQP